MTSPPYDYGEAKAAVERASVAQRNAEQAIKDAFAAYGDAERAYRKALAIKITELRADGVPATVCLDLAKGEKSIADRRYRRDVADGVKEAAMSAMWRHTADRRELEQLIGWSMRVAPLGEYGEELAASGTYGAGAMTFVPKDRDHLFCLCGEPIDLASYVRWGLCSECEAERLARLPWRCPDVVPESWDEAA